MTATVERQRFGDLVAAEVRKLTSLISNRVILVAILVVMIGLALAGSETALHAGTQGLPPGVHVVHPNVVTHGLVGAFLVQLILAVVGTLAFTSEVSSGTLRVSLTACPSRIRLVAAKSLVFVVLAFVVGLIGTLLGFATAALVLHGVSPVPSLTGRVLSAVVGTACYLALLGLLGLALGVLVRRSSGAIFTLAAALLVLPILVGFLPSSLATSIDRLLPLQVGESVILQARNHTLTGALPPWEGLAVVAGYTLVVLALATWRLVRSDL